MENFEPRDKHAGHSTADPGQSNRDKRKLEWAAEAIDQGPSFGTPGDPPDADPGSVDKIEKTYEERERERNTLRAG